MIKWKNILLKINKNNNENVNKKEKKEKEKQDSTTNSNNVQKITKTKKHHFKIANKLLKDMFNPSQTDEKNNDSDNNKNLNKENQKKNNIKRKSADKTKKPKKNISLFIEKLKIILINLENKKELNSLKKFFYNLKQATQKKEKKNPKEKNLSKTHSIKHNSKNKQPKKNKFGIEHLEMDLEKNSYTETNTKYEIKLGNLVESLSSENDNKTNSLKESEKTSSSKKHHKKKSKKKEVINSYNSVSEDSKNSVDDESDGEKTPKKIIPKRNSVFIDNKIKMNCVVEILPHI